MDNSRTPYPLDTVKATEVWLHSGKSLLDVRLGAVGFDLTPYAMRVQQTASEVQVQVTWHDELYATANQPKPGDVIEVKLEGRQFWIGHVQSVNDFNLSSGGKQMTVVARTRDTAPKWRVVKRNTELFPVATPIQHICKKLALAIGVDDTEFFIPPTAIYTVHSATQLADITPWEMLTTMLLPAGLEPYVDALGRLKAISRDTTRPADVAIDNDRLLSVNGTKARSDVTAVQVKWLNPNLTEVKQQGKKLADATQTAGFFQLKQERDILFSDDGTQRARGTYLVIKQSANSGLLRVCSEEYSQNSLTGGKLTLKTYFWVPTLATASISGMVAATYIFDGVSIPSAQTIPFGRIFHGIAEASLMLVMMSIGTGVYEIWGEPFDFVHARNISEAYNINANEWEENIQSIENDFVMDEAMAQAMAVRELTYQYRSASSYGLTIVDDPRLEVGDIVSLNDGSRVYITGYSRDLSPGSAAVLNIEGFRV